jgi:hypothetical protein
MDADIAAKITEARANLADFRRRTALNLSDSHLTVRKTATVIAESRELIIMLDGLTPLR